MPKKNILLAMFDVRPIEKSAGLILAKIKNELNLRQTNKKTKPILAFFQQVPQTPIRETRPQIWVDNSKITKEKTEIQPDNVESFGDHSVLHDDYWEVLIAKLPQRPDFPEKYELTTYSKRAILDELEKTISEPIDVVTELARVGGRIYETVLAKPRPKITSREKTSISEITETEDINPNSSFDSDSKIRPNEPFTESVAELADFFHSPASREIEIWLENLQKNRPPPSSSSALERGRWLSAMKLRKASFKKRARWSSWFRFNRKAKMWFLGLALSGSLIFGLIRHQSIWARNNIIQNGNNAVANLKTAKHELESLNFTKAADSFALAYDDLNKASGTLSQLGASFLSIFGNLPGLSKVKAASNLVEAGQSLSKAGENLSLAFGTLYKTNLLTFLDQSDALQSLSLAKLLTEFKDILIFAEKNVKNADNLLADIDAAAIPADKQELFLNFKEKIPEFQKYIGEAVDYSDFLLRFVGADGVKTYLFLLQNNSELRPTGGFPGTYGLITFEKGYLKKIFVEDVYRADANLKENIIPPIPLQHITPGWGMRDAAWFADFPTSARKVMEFYKLDGGVGVDGVLTITPDVIARIFETIGPIAMPEYGLTLDAANFLTEIQNEVEYKADRAVPKQILSDLQPKFFERLAKQDKDQWLAIFKIVSEAAKQKHILAYFKNPDLEKIAVKNGLAGEMKQSALFINPGQADDYLQVVFSNVKGSKTDFVTENSMDLKVDIEDNGTLNHNLTINRVHNGGDSRYGFYNRDNSAYIKVYTPAGSVLESVQGQSITDFRSLISYEDFGFKKDSDLEYIESTIKRPLASIDVFEESGKTVFGFWLITKPKQIKSVVLKYTTPILLVDGKYSLLWQKQSGTDQDQIGFNFKIPEGKSVKNQSPGLQSFGDSLVLNSNLAEDININIEFR